MSNPKTTGDVGVGARRSALYLLDQVLGEGRLMSELIGSDRFQSLFNVFGPLSKCVRR